MGLPSKGCSTTVEEVVERGNDGLLAERHEVAHLDVNPRGEPKSSVSGVEDLAVAASSRIDGVGLDHRAKLGPEKAARTRACGDGAAWWRGGRELRHSSLRLGDRADGVRFEQVQNECVAQIAPMRSSMRASGWNAKRERSLPGS